VCPLRRYIGFGEDGLYRAFGYTGITVDAGFGIDVQHVVIEVKSLNGTDKGTVSVATVNAGFCNDVSHSDPTSWIQSTTGIPPVTLPSFYEHPILNMNAGLLEDEKDRLKFDSRSWKGAGSRSAKGNSRSPLSRGAQL
jgi:hypothetical protein